MTPQEQHEVPERDDLFARLVPPGVTLEQALDNVTRCLHDEEGEE